MNNTADAKQFCHHLWHQYLEERSYEIPGGYFSPQISVIGTGKHEVSHSLQEFAVLLEREEKQWNGTFVIEQEAYLSLIHIFIPHSSNRSFKVGSLW